MGQDGGLCPWLWAPRAGSPEITLLAPDQQQMQAIQQKLFLSASYPALNMGYKCDLFLRVVKDVALQRGSELRFVLRRISYEQMPQKTTLEPWGWMIDETSRPKGALQCSPAPTSERFAYSLWKTFPPWGLCWVAAGARSLPVGWHLQLEGGDRAVPCGHATFLGSAGDAAWSRGLREPLGRCCPHLRKLSFCGPWGRQPACHGTDSVWPF